MVKLSRVAMLAPLVAGVALVRSRRLARSRGTPETGRRPPVLPLLVVGLLAAIALTSTGVLPPELLSTSTTVQEIVLAAAPVGLGTSIHEPTLRRTGGRSLVLGLGRQHAPSPTPA